jgi:hypothetical protein
MREAFIEILRHARAGVVNLGATMCAQTEPSVRAKKPGAGWRTLLQMRKRNPMLRIES